MIESIRTSLLLLFIAALQTLPLAASAPTRAADKQKTALEWNNPEDIALVSRTFQTWTDAVIAKDRVTVESFHDEGFRAGLGDRLLTKPQHVLLELAVGNTEMKLLKVAATRRVGDILLVWSKHFIRVTSLPEIPSLGLVGDWGDEKAAKRGFTQGEFSVWRFEGGRIKCLAFAASRTPEK